MSKYEEILAVIPNKRFFSIGEASKLCQIKPHVLRYWEQEFPQLKPVKRRGGRRYYQHRDVELICTIGDLLYIQGFTISGAKLRLQTNKVYKGIEVNKLNPPALSKDNPSSASPQLERKSPRNDTRKLSQVIDELENLLEVIQG